jgi:hypothetical protein
LIGVRRGRAMMISEKGRWGELRAGEARKREGMKKWG